MVKKPVSPLKSRLNGVGLRATPSRMAIAKFLEESARPVGTLELTDIMIPDTCDLATLYRTLKSFADKGLANTVSIDSRFASYEWADENVKHHHHLVCRKCGLIEEIPECDLETIEKNILATANNFHGITSHSLEFFGVCTDCARG